MRPVSTRFLKTIRGSHAMRARVRVVTGGLTGTNPGPLDSKGNPVNEIGIESGDVKFDATADIRANLDMTTIADWPRNAAGLLTPYGNELFVERGVVYGDGVTEFVSQGYYRIYAVDQDDAPNGPIQILARDRMSGIIDAKPLAPRQFLSGTAVSAIFASVVGEVYPGAIIDFDFDASLTFSENHVMDDDRYSFLKEIADSLGKVMYWDYAGHLAVKSPPDPRTSVFDVTHGRDGVLVSMGRSLNREGVFNAVVATGEAPGEDPPVRAVAYDLNLTSPTRWNGPFGQVPTEMTSSFITTQDQAQIAADAKLARMVGTPYGVDFTIVPNSALEVLDPVFVTYSDAWNGEMHILDTFTVPLTSDGAMEATTRMQIQGSS